MILTKIERVPFTKGFRLKGGEPWEIYQLVDTHDKEVVRGRPLKMKDTHGKVSSIAWGTEVVVLGDEDES